MYLTPSSVMIQWRTRLLFVLVLNRNHNFGTCKMNSSKQRFHLRAMIAILLRLNTVTGGEICHHKLTRPVLTGFRCVTETEVYTTIVGIEQHLCTYLCVRQNDCSIVNYNTEKTTCHLSNDPCVALEGDEAFQVNYLGLIDRSECLRWLPTSNFDANEAVVSPKCHPTEIVCYVGRLVSSLNVVPGKYLHNSGRVYVVFNADENYNIDASNTKEFLHVRAGCQVTWMPFSAGDAIPLGAVKGGFLASNGATLYIMRAPVAPYAAIFGYYDPVSNTGHLPHIGAVTLDEIELLVLLWTASHQKIINMSICLTPHTSDTYYAD